MPPTPTVLFVCLHGSAKSLIAARHLERLAAGRGITLEASSAGVEPDAAIPPHVVAGLRADGIDVSATRPVKATAGLAAEAGRVVAFGCDLSAIGVDREAVRWDDVPAVSDDYDVARDVIVERVGKLLDEIAATDMRHHS